MTSCCDNVRRARPLLGTYVEIEAAGESSARLHDAIDRAFQDIATVHGLMSFQEEDSELSRLNRGCAPAELHPWTARVLAAASELSERSRGAFDATVGQAGRIDLSGIAKGFAVDRAVETLLRNGAEHGVVNAGGDLRVFGERTVEIGVREPSDPARLAAVAILHDTAFASSGRVLDPRTRRPVAAIDGASVRAGDCMMADALTKVVGVAGEGALPVLRHYGATAVLFCGGRMVTLET